jgi:tyrosyl-tRNA synthetase
LLTDIPADEFRPLIQGDPRNAKVRLAREIISWLHDSRAAAGAEEEWDRIQKGEGIPDDTPEVSVGSEPLKQGHLLVKAGLASSSSEGIRKIKEGAVRLNGEKLADFQAMITISQPTVIQLGRKYARLKP